MKKTIVGGLLALACHKLDGGYEIIPNYSGIN